MPRQENPVPFDHLVDIGIHRDFQVSVALAANGGKLGDFTFPTRGNGYEQLLTWSVQFSNRWHPWLSGEATTRPIRLRITAVVMLR
ncbi:MAG: hypothetical protein ACK5N0_10925 [Synechococcaceae cyanobacterium]